MTISLIIFVVIYMKNFYPKKIYYEPSIINYDLGRELLEKYANVEQIAIDSHNNIPELRAMSNRDFQKLKTYLIIGIRKSLTWQKNEKVSDYLVPYTSSGCSAMCMYCYLVCHYNKCSYLRLFVNREELMNKIVKTVNNSDKNIVLEIGSNSDLILENQITGNLVWTITEFISRTNNGMLTFPTKFSMVDDILHLEHHNRIIPRVSVNPSYIIKNIEIGTSSLEDRVIAINKLVNSGYPTGILLAPIVLIDGWEKMYTALIEYLKNNLSNKAKDTIFFEVIFMTYSFVHNAINKEAFPKSPKLYSKEYMTGRGMGKYVYKGSLKDYAKGVILDLLREHFTNNEIKYIV